MGIPKVNFIYTYPLDRNRRRVFQNKNIGYYPTQNEVRSKLLDWRKIWDEEVNKDDRIIVELSKITKRMPERSLECFVFGGEINPMSTPFLMPIMSRDGKEGICSDEKFVDTMIHEILHIFVSGATKYFDEIRRKYSNEEILTQNHIIVYAFLEKIYLDMFNSKPLNFNREDLPPGYGRAVEIVKELGYENLIQEYYSFL